MAGAGPGRFDALLLTSANAVRLGGSELAKLRDLPVTAVGEATAAAARDAGFRVETIGSGNAVDLLAEQPPALSAVARRGEDHRNIGDRPIERRSLTRRKLSRTPACRRWKGLSPRFTAPRREAAGENWRSAAKRRLQRSAKAAAEACGGGWERLDVAEQPNDKSLLALAARLCHTSYPQ